MSEEDGPKSAIELAMERLRKEDAEVEVTTRKLTDEEKAAIAEVRSPYDSRTAEQEILHRLLTRSTAICGISTPGRHPGGDVAHDHCNGLVSPGRRPASTEHLPPD
jgi:hypothetical protein